MLWFWRYILEQLLIHLRGPMFVGVSQCGLIGRHVDSEMHEFTQTAGQPVADLAQRVRRSQLTEQHRHQLRAAAEALGYSFGPVFLHQRRELQGREVLQQLIKQAHRLYHSVCPPWGIRRRTARSKTVRRWNNYRRALFFAQFKLIFLSWTRVCLNEYSDVVLRGDKNATHPGALGVRAGAPA